MNGRRKPSAARIEVEPPGPAPRPRGAGFKDIDVHLKEFVAKHPGWRQKKWLIPQAVQYIRKIYPGVSTSEVLALVDQWWVMP